MNGPLDKFGLLGLQVFNRQKLLFMLFTGAIALLSFLLLCFGIAGVSNNGDVLKKTAWTIEVDKSSNANVGYFGLDAAYFPDTNFVEYYYDCASVTSTCDDCWIAGNKARNSVGSAMFWVFVLMVCSFIRSCFGNTRDNAIVKLIACGFSFFAMISMLVSFGSWNETCVNNLQSLDDNTFVFKAGPGIGAVGAAFVFVFFSFVLHLLTPTKDATAQAAVNDATPVGTTTVNVMNQPVQGQYPASAPVMQPQYATSGTAPHVATATVIAVNNHKV